ncbi:MAG: AraC family transcriptional regulator [Elusimicrobiota bacterium]
MRSNSECQKIKDGQARIERKVDGAVKKLAEICEIVKSIKTVRNPLSNSYSKQKPLSKYLNEEPFNISWLKAATTEMAYFIQRMWQIKKLIKDHEALLTEVGYSFTKMNQLFRKIIGKSIKIVQREFALEEAGRLLLESDNNVSQIADEVGFADLSFFVREFKKKFGRPPLKYKKSILQGSKNGISSTRILQFNHNNSFI